MPVVHALIGCGRVAPNHADGFLRVAGCDLRWACDREIERARRLQAEWGLSRVTADVDEVFADSQVDSVSILVDHEHHAPLAMAALRAGKHVLVEKPMAVSLAAADAMRAEAERAGRILAVVSQHRFDPLLVAIRGWLESGLLGRPVAASVNLQCGRPREYYADSYWRGSWAGEGGSVLVNQAYHCVDVLVWLLGPLEATGASMATLVLPDSMETEDTLVACVRAARSGALGTIAVTGGGPTFWRTRFELVGTVGRLTFDIDHPDTLHEADGTPELMRAVEAYRTSADPEPPPPGLGYYGISHRRQIAEFAQAAATGGSVTVDAARARETLAVIASIYELTGAPGWP